MRDVFSLSRPADDDVTRFIAAQSALPFTYDAVGASNAETPGGFDVDHNRVRLGDTGCWDAAVAAVRAWKMFDISWVTLLPQDAPIAVGTTVAVVAQALGTWSRNATRIVYVLDTPERFGFAYGTLPGHIECGEERFMVEKVGGEVWYDIRAFSQPRHPLARLGKPVVRRMQARFARASLAAMAAAVATAEP